MSSNASFLCESCGYRSPKWMGFCPQCGSSTPLTETAPTRARVSSPPLVVGIDTAATTTSQRVVTGWGEVDRVLGGGLVPGSAILLGGEPGVGKSTLLLQLAGGLAARGERVLMATAEESVDQVALRATRLGVTAPGIDLIAVDDVDVVVEAAERSRPTLLVVDSIQAVGVGEIPSAPGGVSQVRESAARLIRLAKTTGVSLVLVGHVTKEGGLAGPKVLEHMVDVVLYLEGDPDRGFRVLRSNKNRFGATHVSGMFDMGSAGLSEVEDPSKLFLEGWESEVAGTVVYPAIEGRRCVLVEIQALVAPTTQTQPRRSIRGLDPARVNQVVAVLHRHAGLPLHDAEIYVNVVGGWRLDEPGCDLAVALTLASSALNLPMGRLAVWGEVGLAGEVRSIPMEARRVEELDRMGLQRRIAPGGGEPMRLAEALIRAGLG
ncbi:MAG: DNA repair protein RadA [Actinobacteria bacterium]|nr:DNA repair protein RadA [Actinomycetota bacterium]MCI0677923.1 DNA repair protein RadA [Actinomycetota bacterium]